MKVIGRDKYIKKLLNDTLIEPENKAFFGVKGLGKSTIIGNVFSRPNCKRIAEESHSLYVRTILSPDKKGENLINFLIDKIVTAIDLIDDEVLRDELQEKLEKNLTKYQSKETVLTETLQTIIDYEYSVILVMDEFHNMGRNSAVGSEQYDFLRSLSEAGLLYYWIISDSDFSDVYATEQFTTSFFAQKFQPKTIPQMDVEGVSELLANGAARRELDIDIYAPVAIELIGGIPGLVPPVLDCIEEMNGADISREVLIEKLLSHQACSSLLSVWSRSLTREQKDILILVADKGTISQKEYEGFGGNALGKINQLGDKCGLGLLLHKDMLDDVVWELNTPIFREFIRLREEDFLATSIRKTEVEPIVSGQPQTVINNYYTINNNIFNADSALAALRQIGQWRQMITGGGAMALPDNQIVENAIQQLPFQQEGWDVLDEDEREEKVDAYADKIFESSDFRSDSLSETQMSRFHLTQNILDNLTEGCRNNLISAIQVYDLLQFCVDKFGLTLFNSESARGILFAKVYESILKEILKPALLSVEESATKEVRVNGKFYPFKDAPEQEMTINNFSFVLGQEDVQKSLGVLCTFDLGIDECDGQWWKNHMFEMKKIGFLRNDCCHSGDCFTADKLEELIKRLFEDGAIARVVVYNDIANRIV